MVDGVHGRYLTAVLSACSVTSMLLYVAVRIRFSST